MSCDMLERALELIERLETMYMNKEYLTTSEKKLCDDIDKFFNDIGEGS